MGTLSPGSGIYIRGRHRGHVQREERHQPHRARAPAGDGGTPEHVQRRASHGVERAELLLQVRQRREHTRTGRELMQELQDLRSRTVE